MRDASETSERIARTAARQLGTLGVAKLTVATVAKAADISPGLVHYHFDTKTGLLRAAAERLAAARLERRERAIAGFGIEAVDRLRAVLEDDVASGEERAWHDLAALARDDDGIAGCLARHAQSERERWIERLPPLLASLGAAPAIAPAQLATLVTGCLDGLAQALDRGLTAAAFRSAYDGFWLVLIGAGEQRSRAARA